MSPAPHAEVRLEPAGPVFRITIDRPARRNALDDGVIAAIREGLRQAHADPAMRAILLTGSGDRAFCAGGDLKPGGGFAFDLSQPRLEYGELLRDAHNALLPIVVRVNGACMAGGMGLLCMADLAVCAEDVRFGLPEVKVGLFPMQVLSLLQRMVPRRVLREWVLTGEPFGATEALRWGLVNRVVPRESLDEATAQLLQRLVDNSPTALRRGRHALRAIESMGFEQSLAFAEGQIALLAMTEDAREGMAAFNEKRPPVWPNR
jgi:enoyl-CoA hydratase/carnithine racemase